MDGAATEGWMTQNPGASRHAAAANVPEPRERRTGFTVRLSDVGFRASLFHVSALRRLNEAGVRSGLDTITLVSGERPLAASGASARLSLAMIGGPGPADARQNGPRRRLSPAARSPPCSLTTARCAKPRGTIPCTTRNQGAARSGCPGVSQTGRSKTQDAPTATHRALPDRVVSFAD